MHLNYRTIDNFRALAVKARVERSRRLPRCMELALALGGEPIQREKDVLHR
jgi:hypothetical protein